MGTGDRGEPGYVRPIRSFIAIELEGGARPAVERLVASLARTDADVAWTRPENLHVTLKFLGAVPPARLRALGERLRAVAAGTPPFVLTVAGLGAFPSLRSPRVLWVGTVAPELEGLVDGIERACAAEGFARESRPFHAHVTLGRVRAGRDPRRRRTAARAHGAGLPAGVAELFGDGSRAFGDSRVEEIVLLRSDLRPDGARYTPLLRVHLGARGGALTPLP